MQRAEHRGASREELALLLGSGRSKRGIFEGDLEEGELEIGQVSSLVRKVQPAAEILLEMWREYEALKKSFCP